VVPRSDEAHHGDARASLRHHQPRPLAEERQYLTNQAAVALIAFTRRRGETLEFLGRLEPGDWGRAGVHIDSRGRRTIDQFLSVMAGHVDKHLDQLRRALDGRA